MVPADLASRVPADFSTFTNISEDEQGLMGSGWKRLILFAPDGVPGLERHLGRVGKRGPSPVPGRRRTLRCGLRHHHRLDRQFGGSRFLAGTSPVNPGLASRPSLSFAFNLAKIADHGEDSDPIISDGPDLGLVGVFDGMGGAGRTSETHRTDRVPAPTWRRGLPGMSSKTGCWICSSRTGT